MATTTQELFENSQVSYHFWTDSLRWEDPEELRLAVAEAENDLAKTVTEKRKVVSWTGFGLLLTGFLLLVTISAGLEDVGMHTGDKYVAVVLLLAATCISGLLTLISAFVWADYRTESNTKLKRPFSERLNSNSKKRFTRWLEETETRRPKLYKDIVDWFEAETRGAEAAPGKPKIPRGKSKIPGALRVDVLRRDGSRCLMCGRSVSDGAILHMDHIVPESKGGATSFNNLQTLCSECNIGKGNRYEDDLRH